MKLNVAKNYLDIVEASVEGVWVLPVVNEYQKTLLVYGVGKSNKHITRQHLSEWFTGTDQYLITKTVKMTEWEPGYPDFAEFKIKFAGGIIVPEEEYSVLR